MTSDAKRTSGSKLRSSVARWRRRQSCVGGVRMKSGVVAPKRRSAVGETRSCSRRPSAGRLRRQPWLGSASRLRCSDDARRRRKSGARPWRGPPPASPRSVGARRSGVGRSSTASERRSAGGTSWPSRSDVAWRSTIASARWLTSRWPLPPRNRSQFASSTKRALSADSGPSATLPILARQFLASSRTKGRCQEGEMWWKPS
mmetsp:Transcript_88391/g.202144  ORF Transcript_88391/g.202144 Transcript_88391/m.202144 type:complete len:202 (+) Transcript_88391:540-1145(+)